MMRTVKMSVGLFGIMILVAPVWANPLPECYDAWCHYTKPQITLGFYHNSYHSPTTPQEFYWRKENCPHWPAADDPLFFLVLPINPQKWYSNDVRELWKKDHPEDSKGGLFSIPKLWEQYYWDKQREVYGKVIPYCVTEEAQKRLQQEKKNTEKYLYEASYAPLVRDRLALIAQLEEANAHTAKEWGVKTYVVPTPGVDKAATDAWWAETHPQGKALSKKAIWKRYISFFREKNFSREYWVRRRWKALYPNKPEPSFEEMKNQVAERKRQLESLFTEEELRRGRNFHRGGVFVMHPPKWADFEKIESKEDFVKKMEEWRQKQEESLKKLDQLASLEDMFTALYLPEELEEPEENTSSETPNIQGEVATPEDSFDELVNVQADVTSAENLLPNIQENAAELEEPISSRFSSLLFTGLLVAGIVSVAAIALLRRRNNLLK